MCILIAFIPTKIPSEKFSAQLKKLLLAFLNLHQQFEGQTEIQTAVKFLYPSDSDGATSKAKQNFSPITVSC